MHYVCGVTIPTLKAAFLPCLAVAGFGAPLISHPSVPVLDAAEISHAQTPFCGLTLPASAAAAMKVGRMRALPVLGEKAACTPCQAPLDVPQNVDQNGAIDSFSIGVSCSWTCTCAMQVAACPYCRFRLKIMCICRYGRVALIAS